MKSPGERLSDSICRYWARKILGKALAAVLVFVLAGCATNSHIFRETAGSGAASSNSFGSYLAAQSAAVNQDTAAAADYYQKTLASDPDNILLQQKTFSALVADARFDAALPIARKLAAKNSVSSLPNFFLVLNDVRSGKYQKAIDALTGVPETGFQMLLGPLVRAWSLAGEGKTDEALKSLAVLDETPVFRPFRRNHRALILTYAGDTSAADVAYKESLAADHKGSLRIVLAYGRFLEQIGRAYEAKQIYQKYQTLYPDNVVFLQAERALNAGEVRGPLVSGPADGMAEALYGMSVALAADNATGAAAYHLRLATFLKPDFPDAYLLMGRLFEADDHDELAIKAYDKVPVADILSSEARLRKAWILNDRGHTGKAITLLNNLVAENPKTPEFHISLGDMLRSGKKYDQAINNYSRALNEAGADNKSSWLIYYSRGIAYERSKQWPKAEADFLKALALNPDQPQVLNYLGYSWVEKGLHLDKAQAMLEKAVDLNPNDGFIVDSLGWALFHLQHYGKAVPLLERAVLLQPGDPTLNDHLGDAYWATGRHTEARFQWRHAISLGAAPDEVQKIDRKIDHGLDLEPGTGKPVADSYGH